MSVIRLLIAPVHVHCFSITFVYLLISCISNFRFESRILILIVPVPGHCLSKQNITGTIKTKVLP